MDDDEIDRLLADLGLDLPDTDNPQGEDDPLRWDEIEEWDNGR